MESKLVEETGYESRQTSEVESKGAVVYIVSSLTVQ